MLAANNLSDVASAATALTNLGVTSTAAELNLLDGVSGLVQADFTKLAAIDSSATEINTLDALSRGSLIYGNASAATAVLTKGGANTVLTSDGTDISWAAAASGGGAMEFIASSGAISNAANVSFTQFDASKYDQYQFWFQHVIPATDEVDMYGYVSTDGGSSYDTTNGNYHLQNTTAKPGLLVAESIGSDTNEFGICGYFELFAPHNSSAFTFSSSGNITYQTRSNGGMYQVTNSSNHLVAQDVDAIQFAMSSGNIESGEIVMYGIKNS